nr:hypothetical protein OG409_29990 [Streptomyces sp. NBC_00974]
MSAAALAAYAGSAQYVLLAERDDGTVVRCGDTVAKAHAGDSDPDALAVRIRIAGDAALAGILLPPLRTGLGRVADRAVSLWPYGTPVAPDRPEEAPWEATAELLAGLHRTPLHRLPAPVPPMRGPAKLARALHRLAAAHPPAADAPAGQRVRGRPARVADGARSVGRGGAAGAEAGEGRRPADGDAYGGREAREARDAHDGREARDAREVRKVHDAREARDGRGAREARDAHDSREVHGVPRAYDTREAHDAYDAPGTARLVRAAAATLPAWTRGEAAQPAGGVLCHGDLHLGQLVRGPAGGWRLIDVDDLGLGAPAWDLARPAAWYAAGVLDAETWRRFLDAYRAAGGPAAGPPGSDPWPELDVAARALTVQTAALALVKAAREHRRLDHVERLMVDCCARIASLPPDLERGAPS